MTYDGQQRRRRRSWRTKETQDAEAFGGRTTPGSGNTWHHKGDVRSDTFLIESKDTAAGSYRLTHDTLSAIEKQALLESRIPVLSLRMASRDYVVLTQEDFLAMAALAFTTAERSP